MNIVCPVRVIMLALFGLVTASPTLARGPEWIAPRTEPARPAPSWIWVRGEDGSLPTTRGAPLGSVALWRRLERPADRTIMAARAALAADNHATLHLGGVEVLRSDSWSEPVSAMIDPARFAGAEVMLEIRARNGAPGDRAAIDPGGVCLVLDLTYDDGTTRRVTSGEGWSGRPIKDGADLGDARDGTPAVVLGPSDIGPWRLSPGVFAPPTPCPRLRRAFTLAAKPDAARVRVVGLGHYELRCNGRIVGEDLIKQAWSQYDRTLFWQEFDLEPYLRAGENVLGVTLGQSFWSVGPVNDPRRFSKTDATPDFSSGRPFLLWMEGTLTTGGVTTPFVTDRAWTWSPGPLTFSHIYAGEDFDARLDMPGWDALGFGATGWRPVEIAAAPPAELRPLESPPIRAFEVFAPSQVKRLDARTFTYVFPQNCSSLLRFRVEGPPGARVRFKPCEFMDDAGRVKFTYTWGTGKDIWHDYILRGGAEERHQTLFCYVGAQYVEVEGAVPPGEPNPDGLPVLRSLELVHSRVACREVGSFETGDSIQDGAFRLIDWAIRSNMSHVPTDCPHREKNGWQEQNWHMARAMSYRFDIREYFRKVSRDLADAQTTGGPDDGFVPTNAPWYLVGRPRHDMFNDAPEWGVAAVLVPWHLYEWYGDRRALESNFASMTRFVDYLGRAAKDGVLSSNLGDWYDFGHGKGDGPSRWTPNQVSATAIWALAARTTADAARVLGRPDDEGTYRGVYERVAADFRAKFYDPSTATVKNHGSCQAGNAAALCIGLIPEPDRARAARAILDDLKARDWQQTTGEVLHVFLARALEAHAGPEGVDALWRVYTRTERGSYGFMVRSGLTTLPESWDAKPGTGNSMCHLMLGHLMEWHFASVAGIRQVPGSIGWAAIEIAPTPPPKGSPAAALVTRARAAFDSPRGRIESSWRASDTGGTLDARTPDGVPALVRLPDGRRVNHPGGAAAYTWRW
jgi:alpha-L-rhamnosidase